MSDLVKNVELTHTAIDEVVRETIEEIFPGKHYLVMIYDPNSKAPYELYGFQDDQEPRLLIKDLTYAKAAIEAIIRSFA